MKAMVLAAGKGSRLGEITENQPKPMIKIGGVPVLERNLRWLARHGVHEVAINLHHLGDVIERQIGDGARFHLAVRYSREQELLGTAGAVKELEGFFADGPFLVVYGDNLFDFDLTGLVRAHDRHPGIATLALFDVDRHRHTGMAGGRVELDRSGRILRFVEGSSDPSLKLVNGGCYVLEPTVLGQIPTGRSYDFGKHLFPNLLRNYFVCGHVIEPNGKILGLDTPESLARAREIVSGSGSFVSDSSAS